MNSTYLVESILYELDGETLEEIRKKVQDVPEGHLCTVQIGKGVHGEYDHLYGVFSKTPEELENDRSVWRSGYHSPKHYINMIEVEKREREYFAKMFR